MGHLMTDDFYMSDAIWPQTGPNDPEAAILVPVLAHEIRNAMLCVRELANAASAETDAERQLQALASIARTTDFVITLLADSLRPFDQTPRSDPVSLRELLDDCLSIVATEALRLGKSVHLRLGPGLPATFAGDATRLRQIVANLLRNALRHSGSDRIRLSVLIRRGRLTFAIRDWGCGIGSDRLRQLLRPFSLSDRIEAAGRGNGLGLFISRDLAEKLGGDILAWSSPGKGSIFALSIPFTPIPLAPAEPDCAFAPPHDKAMGTVLLVEDDPILGEMIAQLLHGRGCDVHWARELPVALSALRKLSVDVVLCDHRIGARQALTEIAAAVAAQDGGRRPVLLAMTALVTPETQLDAAAGGFDQVLDKMAGIRVLTDAVMARLSSPVRSEPSS